jgi:hypothetical protein
VVHDFNIVLVNNICTAIRRNTQNICHVFWIYWTSLYTVFLLSRNVKMKVDISACHILYGKL